MESILTSRIRMWRFQLATLAAQVAASADGIGLPEYETIIDEDGHHAIRVEREEGHVLCRAETRTPLLMLKSYAKFRKEPQHLSYID
jgi:hypothetical protein